MSSLSFRRVSVRYGAGVVAVDDVSFDVPGGSLTALLGPSGCGKTTLLRVAAGLLVPDAGDVLVDGRPAAPLPPEQCSDGLVFQSQALFPHLGVLDNVLFPLDAAGENGLAAVDLARASLRTLGLGGLDDARPEQLSGGQQQRVALARSLMLSPSVLLLDEPLSSVEPGLRRALREEIRSLQQGRGITVLYVTHDQREALAVSDRIVLLGDGRVVQQGTPRELYERPSDGFAASFMGEAGVFDGERRAGEVWLGPLPLPGSYPGADGAVRIAVRPEAWRVAPASGRGLSASVIRRYYLGRVMEYVMATPSGEVLVHASQVRAPLEPGAPVSLFLGPHGTSVIG
ncbi:MAG: ABC transporter ATP-binding protein [Ramlibacter sp.]